MRCKQLFSATPVRRFRPAGAERSVATASVNSRAAASLFRLTRIFAAGALLAGSFLFGAGLVSAGAAHAQGGAFYFAGGANIQMPLESIEKRKFSTVVRQQFDFSCGSAALATLLTHHYNRRTVETEAFRAMWEAGDQTRIRELGFSLFEMKSYLESIGLLADGFKVTTDRLADIGVPGIALINDRGYRHFVVVKGITRKSILLGDPSKGLMSISRRRFEKIWDGTILYIRSDLSTGKNSFNRVSEWKLSPSAPARDDPLEYESLEEQVLSQTRPSFSGFTIPAEQGLNP